MTDHPGLRTPGAVIRGAREAQGITLDELSGRTKIPPPVLAALEADEYHKISGALYIKSFLRTCAAELALDAEEILSLYAGVSGAEKPTGGGADMVWREEEVQISRVGLPWRRIAVAGLAVVVAAGGLTAALRGCGRSDDGAPEAARPVPLASSAAPTETGGTADRGGSPADSAGAETPEDQDLGARVTVQETQPAADDQERPGVAAPPDTLAGAWLEGRDGAPAPGASAEAEASVAGGVEAGADTGPDTGPIVLPLVPNPGLDFAGDARYPLVLRVVSAVRQEIAVQIDSPPEFRSARWPAGGEPPELPRTGIEPGRVYASSRGYTVYWGAEDHFTLQLARPTEAEATLNGTPQDLSKLAPGGRILLDVERLGGGN